MRSKERVDVLMVEAGLAESRAIAQRLVMAGQVLLDGQVVDKPSRRVEEGSRLAVRSGPRFVSRGGDKLDAALQAFHLAVDDGVCADVGASTGGFTDCLLQSGARRVYAIDVGHGVLHWTLRNDPRVIVMERTNARSLTSLPEPVDLATADASFISLRLLLPPMAGWLHPGGDLIALIKPQFEAGREAVPRGGVVRDPDEHRKVLYNVIGWADESGLGLKGLLRSPLLGPKGNVEFLLWCRKGEVGLAASECVEEALRSGEVGREWAR